MAPPISDAVVVDVLRKVDRLTTPLVRGLARRPTQEQDRRDWFWAERVPPVAAVLAAAPRFAGKLADLLPLQNTVGTAVQCLVVLGVATEHAVTDPAERVSLLAQVLLGRDLAPDLVQKLIDERPKGAYRDDALGARTGPVRTVWRASRLLARIDDALDARPKGKLRHRALANLPVVGVAGGYAAEREGLRRAAATTAALLASVRR